MWSVAIVLVATLELVVDLRIRVVLIGLELVGWQVREGVVLVVSKGSGVELREQTFRLGEQRGDVESFRGRVNGSLHSPHLLGSVEGVQLVGSGHSALVSGQEEVEGRVTRSGSGLFDLLFQSHSKLFFLLPLLFLTHVSVSLLVVGGVRRARVADSFQPLIQLDRVWSFEDVSL